MLTVGFVAIVLVTAGIVRAHDVVIIQRNPCAPLAIAAGGGAIPVEIDAETRIARHCEVHSLTPFTFQAVIRHRTCLVGQRYWVPCTVRRRWLAEQATRHEQNS